MLCIWYKLLVNIVLPFLEWFKNIYSSYKLYWHIYIFSNAFLFLCTITRNQGPTLLVVTATSRQHGPKQSHEYFMPSLLYILLPRSNSWNVADKGICWCLPCKDSWKWATLLSNVSNNCINLTSRLISKITVLIFNDVCQWWCQAATAWSRSWWGNLDFGAEDLNWSTWIF